VSILIQVLAIDWKPHSEISIERGVGRRARRRSVKM
jgi:hypothetical protein